MTSEALSAPMGEMTLKEARTQVQKFLLMAILATLVVFSIDALLIPSDYHFLTPILLISITAVFGWLWERRAGTQSDWMGNLILALVLLGAGVVMVWRHLFDRPGTWLIPFLFRLYPLGLASVIIHEFWLAWRKFGKKP